MKPSLLRPMPDPPKVAKGILAFMTNGTIYKADTQHFDPAKVPWMTLNARKSKQDFHVPCQQVFRPTRLVFERSRDPKGRVLLTSLQFANIENIAETSAIESFDYLDFLVFSTISAGQGVVAEFDNRSAMPFVMKCWLEGVYAL